jgi:hypothetical protein
MKTESQQLIQTIKHIIKISIFLQTPYCDFALLVVLLAQVQILWAVYGPNRSDQTL